MVQIIFNFITFLFLVVIVVFYGFMDLLVPKSLALMFVWTFISYQFPSINDLVTPYSQCQKTINFLPFLGCYSNWIIHK